MNMKRTLVVEGGGFRTAFSAGVLDAFLISNQFDYDRLIGVSGGAIALSYYLSKQYRTYYQSMRFLSKDAHFLKWQRALSPEGYMDIDYMKQIATGPFYFDVNRAMDNSEKKDVWFVATNKNTGDAEYLYPEESNWVDCVIASSTLPFVTKGMHEVNGQPLMDGGWSDPLPVMKAVEMGTEEITIIRTNPRDLKVSQTWIDYFASFYFRENASFQACFKRNSEMYNEAVKYMENPDDNITVKQIAPEKFLESSATSYTKKSIGNDYRYGLDMGLQFIAQQKLSETALTVQSKQVG